MEAAGPRALHPERVAGLGEVLALEVAELDQPALLVGELLDRGACLDVQPIVGLHLRLVHPAAVPAPAPAGGRLVIERGGVQRSQLHVAEHGARRAARSQGGATWVIDVVGWLRVRDDSFSTE